MRATLDVTWFLLGVAGWVLVAVTLYHNEWKISTTTIYSTIYENLWGACVLRNSVTNCLRFDLLGLPAHIHGCRVLMVGALLLGGVASVGVTALGLSGRMVEHKVKIVVTGGGLFIFSGVFTLIAVSWYASTVAEQFYDPFYPGVKFDLGSGVYLGWAASALSILGGSMLWVSMLCCCCDPPRPSVMYAPTTTTHHDKHRVATTFV